MLDKQFFLFQMSGIYQIIPNSMITKGEEMGVISFNPWKFS